MNTKLMNGLLLFLAERKLLTFSPSDLPRLLFRRSITDVEHSVAEVSQALDSLQQQGLVEPSVDELTGEILGYKITRNGVLKHERLHKAS